MARVPVGEDGLPLVVLDEAHRFIGARGTAYRVGPGDAIRIQVGDANIVTSTGDVPTAAHVMFGRQMLFPPFCQCLLG